MRRKSLDSNLKHFGQKNPSPNCRGKIFYLRLVEDFAADLLEVVAVLVEDFGADLLEVVADFVEDFEAGLLEVVADFAEDFAAGLVEVVADLVEDFAGLTFLMTV